MKRTLALLCGVLLAYFCSPILPAAAEWVRIEVNGISYCLDMQTGARFQPLYQGKSDVTKACRNLGAFVGWLDNQAEAASVRYTLVVNPDGTRDTNYPDGTKPPAQVDLTWNAACLTSALAPIASQFVGTLTSINVRTCLTGTNSAAANIAENGGADWSIASSGSGNTLDNAGLNTGSGTITLTATFGTESALSDGFPWVYQASGTDSTPPNPVTGCVPTSRTTTTVTLECDSTTDPDDAVDDSGVAVYRFYKDGVQIDTLTAASPGMSNDYDCAAIGTAGGSPSAMQSGAAWSFESAGAGLEGTADNTYQCSKAVSGSSFDAVMSVSVLDNAGPYNKPYLELRDSLNANSVGAMCALQYSGSGQFFLNSRNRVTTGGSRASATTTALTTDFQKTYVKLHYDSTDGLDCETSTDGAAWTPRLTNYPVTLQNSKVFSFGCTPTQAGTNGTCTLDFVSLNNVGRISKTLTPGDSSSHTYTVKAGDVSTNLSTALAGVTVSTSSGSTGLMKWEPGIYGGHQKTVIRDWPVANILSDVTNEICPNANLKGLHIYAYSGWYVNGTNAASPTYGGTDHGVWGFNAIDSLLSALASCSSGRKFLILSMVNCTGTHDPNMGDQFMPTFMITATDGGPSGLHATGGLAPDTSNVYPIVGETQYGNGVCIDLADADNRAQIISWAQAYCNRYENNPSFHGFSLTYTNSFPFNSSWYSAGNYAAWNATQHAVTQATRDACPTTMVHVWNDWGTPNPGESRTTLDLVDSIDGIQHTNDTLPNSSSWGDECYTGTNPGCSDYRGVGGEPFVAGWGQISDPEVCGYPSFGPFTPAENYARLQTGGPSDTNADRPYLPQYIIIDMSTRCNNLSGYGWDDWKTYLNTLGGSLVFDGVNSTRRTPAYVKANVCPFSRGCQTN